MLISQKLTELGHQIIGVDNMSSGYEDNIPKEIKFFNLDCCDLQKMNDVMKNIYSLFFVVGHTF